MPLKVEIVKKEMIKPSSPTPQHLKELKLSFLDQLAPPVYIPLIFFYEANQIHGQKQQCQLLKSSFSKALFHYYPLAGRATDSYSIDCNDAGALFVEAKFDGDLFGITENPDMDDLKQLLPLDPNSLGIGSLGIGIEQEHEEEQVLLAVQFNLMNCGGTAVAVQMSHKLADGHSLVAFMKSWAAISRRQHDDGEDADHQITRPWFDLASLFPPIDLSTSRFNATMSITKENIITKRLVFDKEKLETLKSAAASTSPTLSTNRVITDHPPTRVEVISCLIWKHFLEVMKRKSGGNKQKQIVALHAVNLRPRMNPSLPDHAFGNIWRPTAAVPPEMQPTATEGENGLFLKTRVAIENINETFVASLLKGDEYLHHSKPFLEAMSKGEIELCRFTSWSRFPMYDVDYGWGKPVWVSTTTLPFKNVAILLNTKNGDGIEVWINLLEEDASVFETDYILNSSP